jgi:hypothetical protein
MALYVSTPICIEAVRDIQKAFAFPEDEPSSSMASSPTITVTGRNGTSVYATGLVKDGEFIASDEWEICLKQADEHNRLSLFAFHGDLEVRIGGVLLATFNDDDSQLSIAGGSSTSCSSTTTTSVGICFSESGMILRIIGDGLRKILSATTPTTIKQHHQVKFKVDLEEKKEECH